MESSLNTKQRIIEQCRYRPMFPQLAVRESRTISNNGAIQTFKHPGDITLGVLGRKRIVEEFTWDVR
jgi:hypothetical protein